MAQVLDVACALAESREFIQQQFDRNALREQLKQRLLAGAQAAGRTIRPEEIDQALDLYLNNLHAFKEPPWSWPVFLAHLYVRRIAILSTLAGGTAAVCLLWWSLFSISSPFSSAGKRYRQTEAAWASLHQQATDIRALTTDSQILTAIDRDLAAAKQQREHRDADSLRRVQAALAAQREALAEEYEIRVVSEPGRKAGIDRYYEDRDGKRVSGYYLLVEAKTPDGRVLPRQIMNAETKKAAVVSTWGERVPKAVYDRLVADRKADGILDETLFGRKRKGTTQEEIVIPGADGQPLPRTAQITAW